MNQINSTLFALNKDGSLQEWRVYATGGEVVVEFGKKGGKFQTKVTKCEPKNIGRANETTAEEQALLEAQSKWEKQVRLGYRDDTTKLVSEEIQSVMLAHDYLKRPNALILPCYIQPKLDGVRAMVTIGSKGVQFTSRGNKLYPVQGVLVDQVRELSHTTGFDKFDGELYIHGLSLQKIVALAKKWRTPADIEIEIEKDYQGDIKRRDKAIKAGEVEWKDFDGELRSVEEVPVKDVDRYCGYSSEDLQLHIFDIPVNNNSVWYDPKYQGHCRLSDLECVFNAVDEDAATYSMINVLLGRFADTLDEVETSIGEYMQDGFEGTIIRNFRGKYEYGQRSSDLLKWKLFKSAEAKVVGSKEDKNGEGVLDCIEKDGTLFSCKMKGTHSSRTQAKMLKLIDSFITFKYQARTDDGVPQFPVGQCVRDVNPLTWEPLI